MMPADLRECSRCANIVRQSARFCDTCGLDLSKPSVFESELKYVTVLFGDVVNSTELIAGRSPEEARAALTPAVNAMVGAVREFGGTVHSVLGDGVLALFGAPVSQEDHALRSCHAALRIQQSTAGLREEIRFRIGLASGPTLFSSQGGTTPGDLSAFGATIHLASRLQTLARPGTTLCAGTTKALAGRQMEMTPLGPLALRGFGGTQEVFSLTSLSRSEPGFNPTPLRDLSPFVGRERELQQLLDHARGFRDGELPSLAIVADAGTGKSRLAMEAARVLAQEGWAVLQVGAASYGRDVPYQVLAGLIRAALGLDRDAGRAPERLETELARIGADAPHGPALLSLLGLPLGDAAAGWDVLDPFRRRDAIADATRAVLDGITHRLPTLLLIDDLQWADEESLKALDFGPDGGPGPLLIATHRPDFAPSWQARRLRVIHLPPLPPESTSALIRHAFPDLVEALREPLVARAEGNPFFVEELARDALAFPAGTASAVVALPPTIQTVLASRVDRLAPEDKRVALTAAALGTLFPLRHLRALFRDQPEGMFRQQLSTLAHFGILRPVEFDEDVAFSHALVQEVAYAGIPGDERRELHRRIARALRASGGNLQDQSETLVYHAARGEEWEDLIDAARMAGLRAARQSAYAAAARFLQQAIDACRRLPRTKARLAMEIDLRFELRVTLIPTEGIEHSLANSTEAEWLARELGDSGRLGWATAYLARDLQLVGRPRDAVAMASRALTHAKDDQKLQMAAQYFAAQAAYSTGDYADAATWLFELLGTLEAVDPGAWTGTTGPAIVIFRAWLIWSLARLGRSEAAMAEAARMRALADSFDLPLGKMLAHLSEGYALAHTGSLTEAEAALRASLSLCRRWEMFAWSTNIMSCLGHVLSRQGRFEEAFEMLNEAVERTRKIGVLVNHAQELAWLADTHRLAGEHQIAIGKADEAIAVARQHEERGNEALAHFVRGEACCDAGAWESGRASVAAALSIARATGMAPLAAQCATRLESSLEPGRSANAE